MFGTTGKHSGAEVVLGFTRRGGWEGQLRDIRSGLRRPKEPEHEIEW